MKYFLLFVDFAAALSGCSEGTGYLPQNGDIVFQISQSTQSRAIQLATHSPYSHMGIVYLRDGDPMVFEAAQPVKLTPLDEWVARGKDGHFVVKRLREAERVLSPDTLQRIRAIGEEFAGRDYDLYFEWSDKRIYCSELVWKVFARGAGIQIGRLVTMGKLDLSHPVVEAALRERFGDNVPLKEKVISPAAMFSSAALETIYKN